MSRTGAALILTAALLVLCAAPAGAGAVSFSGPTNFGAGSFPTSVAVGDFNGDSKLDLAVANAGSGNISILLGNGTGGFGGPTNFGGFNGPESVAVGDFNGDSKLDLAVANGGSFTVSILLGDGTGGFSGPTDFAAGDGPTSVAVGDFNGDSKLDLAVANGSSGNVSILLGNGSGSFSAATNFAVGSNPFSVAVGDFNGDSKLDLAVANFSSGNVSILLGNGSGGFGGPTDFAAGGFSISVAIGDFNGDSKPDLAVANAGFGTVSILLGNGSGGFGAATNFSVAGNARSVAIGDFNGDSKLDLAIANEGGGNVLILLGNGSGGFGGPTDFAAGGGPHSVAVSDFNGDSKLDLAVANGNSNNVSILLGQAEPTLSTNASSGIVLGAGSLSDSATLAGGFGPGGNVTFKLYGPDDGDCSGGAISTSTKPVSGNGSYDSDPFTPTAAGTYRWTAEYSGDANNEAATSGCNAPNESTVVGKATPTLATTASPDIVTGESIHDTATLAGGFNPTGTIVFRLYGPDDGDCSGSPLIANTVSVDSGNDDYDSIDFTPAAAGAYRWVASYSGDAANAPVSGACNDPNESVTVSLFPPSCENLETSTIEGRPVAVDLDCSGGGTLQFEVVNDPSHGEVSSLDSATGRLTYTPTTPFGGVDSLEYRASNGGGDSFIAELSIEVDPVPPAADGVYWGKTGSGAIRVGALGDSGSLASWDLFAGQSSPNGVAIDAAANRIYWADLEAGAIRVGNLDGSGTVSTLFGDEDEPEGVAVDPTAGKMYWASNDGGAIRVGNLDGSGTPSTLFAGEGAPTGVAIDPAAGKIYWTTVGAGLFSGAIRVGNLDGSGTPSTLFGSQFLPIGVAVDPAAGKIYWADPGLAAVRVGNLDGSGSASTLFAGEAFPIGVAVDPAAGKVYWANFGSGKVRAGRQDGGGTAASVFSGPSTDLPAFTALLRAPQGAGAPTISGGGGLGEQLTCSQGSWAADLLGSFLYRAPHAFAYQWRKDGSDLGAATEATYTPTAPGDYSCRVTASNQAGESGPQTSAAVTVSAATPTLSTNASSGIVLGAGSLSDSATLAGGFGPGGNVTFKLYGPDDGDCSGGAISTSTKPVSGNGSYDSDPFTPTAAGTYRWTAEYSGDANNEPAASGCNAPNESTVVAKATPTLATTASPDIALGAGHLSDSATVSGRVNPQAGATVTFDLYGPDNSDCHGTPLFTETVSYPTSEGPVSPAPAGFTPTAAGTYRWTAEYSGDANNDAATSGCNAPNESTVVGKATPTLATTASADVVIGGKVHDTATLAGGFSPGGAIEFKLYGPGNTTCAGDPAFSTTVAVAGNGSYDSPEFTPTTAGDYRWTASYPGDPGNEPAATSCADPGAAVEVAKAATATALEASPNPTLKATPSSLRLTATLSGGASPSGQVSFLDGTTPIGVAPLEGARAIFTPTDLAAGSHQIVARYEGDANNQPSASAPLTVTIQEPAPKVTVIYNPNHPHAPNPRGGPRYAFRFADEAPDVTFYCRLDKAPFKRCHSPKVYRHLKRGRHVFKIKSVDAAGRESAVRTVRFFAGRRR